MNYLQSAFSFIIITTAGIFTVMGNGCAQTPVQPIMKSRVYTAQDSSIQAAVGQEFTIILDSNPTTGYSWEFSSPPDEQIIELIDSSFQPPRTRLKGAGGKQLWIFRAAASGQTTISLKYIRPWEKGIPPVRTASFAVVVENPD